MVKDVWVFVEHRERRVDSVSFELLDEGRRIADRLHSELVAVAFGHQLPDWSAVLGGYGADLVCGVDHPLLSDYTTDAYAATLVALIRERSPFLVLLAASANGRDLAPRVAARLGVGLASDCTLVKVNFDGTIEATRPTHHDKVYTTVALTAAPPFIATIRPGAIGMGKPDPSRQARVEGVGPHLDSTAMMTRSLRTGRADPATIDVAEAEIIVSGGRGLGSAGQWHLVEELAEALGGSVAGSRMAMDAGWIPRERLVGQTGKSVSPHLYFALGISGAREHVAGIREATNVVAVNSDPNAPVFSVAHKSAVGDVNEIVPALIRKLRQLRASRAEEGQGGS